MLLGATESTEDCLDAADANNDAVVNILDPIGLLNHVFRGGQSPSYPGSFIAGSDATADLLHCEEVEQ